MVVTAALWFLLSRPTGLGYGTIAAVYVASALPFLLAGTIVSSAIAEAIERVDRAYFFDLAGAATGCLVLIPFLNLFGGPNTVLAAGSSTPSARPSGFARRDKPGCARPPY